MHRFLMGWMSLLIATASAAQPVAERLFLPQLSLRQGTAVVTIGGSGERPGQVIAVNADAGRERWTLPGRHLHQTPVPLSENRALVRTVALDDPQAEVWQIVDLLTGHTMGQIPEPNPGTFVGVAAHNTRWLVTASAQLIDLEQAQHVGPLAGGTLIQASLQGDQLVYLAQDPAGLLSLHRYDLAAQAPLSVARVTLTDSDIQDWTLLGADETVAVFWRNDTRSVVCWETQTAQTRWATPMQTALRAYNRAEFLPGGSVRLTRPHHTLDAWSFDLFAGSATRTQGFGLDPVDALHAQEIVTASAQVGHLLVVLTGQRRAVGFDAVTGQQVWQTRLPRVDDLDALPRDNSLVVEGQHAAVLVPQGVFTINLRTGRGRLTEIELMRLPGDRPDPRFELPLEPGTPARPRRPFRRF